METPHTDTRKALSDALDAVDARIREIPGLVHSLQEELDRLTTNREGLRALIGKIITD